jgi:phosphomannomutase
MNSGVAAIDFSQRIADRIRPLKSVLPLNLSEKIQEAIFPENGKPLQFWEVANLLGNFYNDTARSPEQVKVCAEIIAEIREYMGRRARESQLTSTVVFGTSGWRGVIGEDFTVLNVHKVMRGIIGMLQSPEFLKTVGMPSFEEIRRAGILVLRDNRFMGEEFCRAAFAELAAAGIKIYDAGQCPTGVGSAILTELNSAGSVNFTPSHNPMEYAGVKFNPADGGPADVNLTRLIEEYANQFMQPDVRFEPATLPSEAVIKTVNAADIFTKFVLRESRVFNLSKIRAWLSMNKNRLFILIDFMHGAARGYVENLLGNKVIEELVFAGALEFINTNDDYSFHGVKPEPSAKNQRPLMNRLQQVNRPLTLAVALDPDADRIRYADAAMDIDMNRFGAIAYANLLERGFQGGLASTAPTSDFALEIARQNHQPVYETAVGFKNFREPLSSGKAVMAFEESDGITFAGHTLEKCALSGLLAALDVMAASNMNLSQVYTGLQGKYGYFYPDKAGADVKGVSVEEWQSYQKKVLHILKHEMFVPGGQVQIGSEQKTIAAINIIDGLKVIFGDKSWILLRPSGTEPKFRYYYEVASDRPLADANKRLDEFREAASSILTEARSRIK